MPESWLRMTVPGNEARAALGLSPAAKEPAPDSCNCAGVCEGSGPGATASVNPSGSQGLFVPSTENLLFEKGLKAMDGYFWSSVLLND